MRRDWIVDAMGWETMAQTTVTKRLWGRFAVSAAIVGVVLAIGKAIPVPGIDPDALAATIRLCTTGTGLTLWHIGDPVCTVAPPPHKQLGGQALLGVAALLAFLILSVRRLLARH